LYFSVRIGSVCRTAELPGTTQILFSTQVFGTQILSLSKLLMHDALHHFGDTTILTTSAGVKTRITSPLLPVYRNYEELVAMIYLLG